MALEADPSGRPLLRETKVIAKPVAVPIWADAGAASERRVTPAAGDCLQGLQGVTLPLLRPGGCWQRAEGLRGGRTSCPENPAPGVAAGAARARLGPAPAVGTLPAGPRPPEREQVLKADVPVPRLKCA